MLADIDFDIVCHLGHVRNVAVSTRGVYFIKVALLFGKVPQVVAPTSLSLTKSPASTLMHPTGDPSSNPKGAIKIAPVGVFSAPTSIDSTVKGLAIPAAPIINLCHVDEHSNSFCSRSFVVRYKDEEHELNDGVHWRITMPDVDLSELGANAPACLDLLHINFKLMGIQLVNDPTVDMMRDVHKLLPAASEDFGIDTSELDFKLVSEQTLTVQRTSSGLHELYPLRFDRLNFLDVDCMVHCAVTGVWYKGITLNVTKGVKGGGKKSKSSRRKNADPMRTDLDEASPLSNISSDYHVLRDHFSAAPASSSQKSRAARKPESTNLVVVPEKGSTLQKMKSMASRRGSALWHDKRGDDKEKAKARIALPMAPSKFSSESALAETHGEPDDAEPLPTPEEEGEYALDEVEDPPAEAARPNERRARCGIPLQEMERVAAMCTGPVLANYKTLFGGTEEVLKIYQSSISRGSNESLSEQRCEVEDLSAIVERMAAAAVSAEAEAVLYDAIKACNAQVTARWSLLFSALPRIMPSLRESLLWQYRERMRLFWKRQMLVHTVACATVDSVSKADAFDLLGVLEEQVRAECGLLASGPASLSVLARGMPVFDYHVQLQLLKLPYVALQQYTSEEHVSYGLLFDDEIGVHQSSTDAAVAERAVRGGRLLNCVDDVVSSELGDIVDLSSARRWHLTHTASTSAALGAAAPDTGPGASRPIGSSGGEEEEEEEDARQVGPSMRTGAVVSEITSDSRGLRTHSIKYGHQQFIRTSGVLAPTSFADGEAAPHLIVLQHGFQGHSYDMGLLVNHFAIELPARSTHVLAARSNEKKNEDSIVEMGKRLAAEVVSYVRDRCPSLLRAGGGRLSFVGHSMGSLVVRRALQEPVMRLLLPNLHTFLSLSSPHLGTLHAESQLVATGLWALLKWKKCPGLQELVLEDGRGGDIRKSVIYNLAGNGALSHFAHVILVSSPQDQYVPSYSARVQICNRVEQDARNGPALREMTLKLLGQVSPDRLVRVTVGNNGGDGIDIDSLIGRKAHLCFLENSIAVSQLVHNLYSYFA